MPARRRAVLAVSAFVVLQFSACSGNGNGTDGGPDRLPLDERLEPGEVRAGVIEKESELLAGPEAHGWVGDFKIYNDRVAFVIQGIHDPRSFGMYGGSLLDADRVREEGAPGEDRLQEVFPQINLLTMFPTGAEVAGDGSDGQPAVVRITGRHQGIPPLDAALGATVAPRELEIIHEYVLEPDAEHLVIRTSLRSRERGGVAVSAGDVVLHGDRTTRFVPGTFVSASTPMPPGEHDYYAGFAARICYLYAGVAGGVRNTLSLHEVAILTTAEGTAPRDEPLVIERILLVGAGGLDDCLRRLHAWTGASQGGLLGGTVRDTASHPEADVTILLRDVSRVEGKDVVNQTTTDSAGNYEVELEPGSYRVAVQARARGEHVSDAIAVVASQTSPHDVVLAEAARLAYTCLAGDGSPLPCKVSLQEGQDAAWNAPVRMDFLVFGPTGSGEVVVPPGDWTVTLSRGWEYGIHRQNITTSAGDTVTVSGTLVRQVDTTGYIAADLHTHCTRSIDSAYAIDDKIASQLAEGVELVVITDHDCTTDFAPQIEQMKESLSFDPDAWLRVVSGNEISPHYGHSTVFPLTSHPAGWSYWQFPTQLYEDGLFVRQLEFPEVWPDVRAQGAGIINLAHPLSYNAWFSYLGFDPPDVIPRLDDLPTDKFSLDFDTMELLTMDDVDVMLEKVLPLWAAMNNQGVFKTAVGVSDAHERDAEAGFGRTMVASPADDPADIDLDTIWAALKKGDAMVAGGIFARLTVQDQPPGELVTATPPLEVRLLVQAADWVPAGELVLLANGEAIETRTLLPPGQVDPARPAVRLDESIQVAPAVDTWYAALVTGAAGATLDPVFRGCRPVGLTNAVRVDADRNGAFDAPER